MSASKSVRRRVAFPDQKSGPWILEIELGAVSGRVECIGLKISPIGTPADQALTVSVLREAPLNTLVREHRIEPTDDLLDLVGIELPTTAGDLGDAGLGVLAADRPRPPGRPEVPLETIEEAARIYLSAPVAPRQAVADQLRTSPSNASKWIQRARSLGLIGPTTPGKRSGRPVS